MTNTTDLITGENPSLFKQGETPWYYFTIEVEDSNGVFSALPLTGATVYFKADNKETGEQKWKVTCEITDAANGKCKAHLSTTDTDAEGDYIGEVEVQKDSEIYKSLDFRIRILEARNS